MLARTKMNYNVLLAAAIHWNVAFSFKHSTRAAAKPKSIQVVEKLTALADRRK